jgi:SAM-dependent methyltransferase
MRPFWHPVSALLPKGLPSFATDRLLERSLAADGGVGLTYCGDSMWPALRHGETLFVEPVAQNDIVPGLVVIAGGSDLPVVRRVCSRSQREILVCADADPGAFEAIDLSRVLGRTGQRAQTVGRIRMTLNRLFLDLREAWGQTPPDDLSAEESIRGKYDYQAPAYAAQSLADEEPGICLRLANSLSGGSRILVLGSGAGRECLFLARRGFRVTGVDFAPAMIETANSTASEAGLEINYELSDIRNFACPPKSFDAALFTNDVYSFIANREHRIRLLQNIRRGLGDQGVVYLSARRVRTLYQRVILTILWLRLRRRAATEWGASHTRWIQANGSVQRAYIHYLSARRLRREVAAAGLSLYHWRDGLAVVVPQASGPEHDG